MGHAAIIVAERKALLARTESLVREFHPALPAGAVIHAMTRCRAELLRAGVRRGLAGITEARVPAQLGRTTADVGGVRVGGDSPVARPTAPGSRDGRTSSRPADRAEPCRRSSQPS